MHCPLCDGDLEPLKLQSNDGELRQSRRCNRCGGFWFEKDMDNDLSGESVGDYDTAQPNYSLQSSNLSCPTDQTLLDQSEADVQPTGLKIWSCPECSGTFYPRGQLALATDWQAEQSKERSLGVYSRSRAALAVALVVLGVSAASAVFTGNYQAVTATSTLPMASPNTLILVLLAVTYLAGTTLAVLGRKTSIILMGWAVIVVCLFSFAVIIFSP
jgi:Zn-finger nucleic acid-binding protein